MLQLAAWVGLGVSYSCLFPCPSPPTGSQGCVLSSCLVLMFSAKGRDQHRVPLLRPQHPTLLMVMSGASVRISSIWGLETGRLQPLPLPSAAGLALCAGRRRGWRGQPRLVGFSRWCCHEQPQLFLLGIPLILYGVLLFSAVNIRLSWGWGRGGELALSFTRL